MEGKQSEMENMGITNLASFFADKKVFVTGHTGFKGSWLTTTLLHFGAVVKGYSLITDYENVIYNDLKENPNFSELIADINDLNKLQTEVATFQPDIVFHLAAQPLVRLSYAEPITTFQTNVMGTANLLESVKALTKKCTVILITTDKVYHNKEVDIYYAETDRLGGYDPYSASKAACEIVISSYRNSFFNINNYVLHQKKIVAVRAGNVIGGGDGSKDRIIPDIVNALKNETPITVRNPNAIRPWQHVLEPVVGYLQIAQKCYTGEKFFLDALNFGPEMDDHLTVKQLVEKAIAYWGKGNWIDTSNTSNLHEATLLKLDISLAKKVLNWKPRLNADKAIQFTFEWYREAILNNNNIALQQIKAFLAL